MVLVIFNVQDRIKSVFPENLIGCNTISTYENFNKDFNKYEYKYDILMNRLEDSPKNKLQNLW